MTEERGIVGKNLQLWEEEQKEQEQGEMAFYATPECDTQLPRGLLSRLFIFAPR